MAAAKFSTSSLPIPEEVKLNKVFEPRPDASHIVIISSRKLSDTEGQCLDNHGSFTRWNDKLKTFKISEIFEQFQSRFLVFELTDTDDSAFISTSFRELKGYKLILLKKPSESFTEPWIQQFCDGEFNVNILETLERPDLIRDSDFLTYLFEYHHVEMPKPDGCACLNAVIPIVKAFLA